MTTPNPTIFRDEALEYRLRNKGRHTTEVIFPRWMARRVAINLWLLLSLLGTSGVAACFAPVPVSGSGLAIVMGTSSQASDAMSVAVLMPQEYESRLHPGLAVKVSLGGADLTVNGTVMTIEPEPLDSAAAEQRLGLPASSLAMLDGHVLLVRVNMTAAATDMLVPGTTGRAELPIGSRHVGAFLPLVGRLFRSDI